MTEPPDTFRDTELGPLPPAWEVVRLGDVVEFSKKPRSLKIDEEEEVPFLPMELVPQNGTEVKDWNMKKFSDISSGTFFFKDDLIVGKITPCFENGKQALLRNLPKEYGYATTEVWAFHPIKEGLLTETIYHYVRLPLVRSQLASKMEGSTNRQRLPRHVLEELTIPLPPLPEQRRIAAVLSTVQGAKEKTEDVIAATRALKKSLMKHLFSYGPVPLSETGTVALKDSELGPVPEEWEVVRLGEVATVNMGQSPPGTTYNTKGKGMPFLQGKAEFRETSPKHIKYTTKPLKKAQKGSVLFSVRAPVGDVNIADMDYCIGRGLASLSLQNGDDIFLFFLLNYFKADIEKEGTGSTFKAINKSKLTEFKIPHPPLHTQHQIADILSAVDRKLEAEENKKKALEELFKTLLADLMTARVRVNDMSI